jgi:murein DD-endopeptidase MepM/ murein hydrolase activator NlpD
LSGGSSHVKSRRYTIVVADRTTGVVRRFTVSLRPALTVVAVLFSLPVLIGLGARWSALAEVADLRTTAASLQLQNESFRAMTAELTGQVEGVQNAIGELTEKAKLDPESARALAKLPASVKTRVMGGGSAEIPVSRSLLSPSLASPENPFGTLREVLSRLTSRLEQTQVDLDNRAEILNATPSIWPARGPLSATFGSREDPFGQGREWHTGIDISGERGDPVFATGDGVIESAGWNGDYGNMVVINHNHVGFVTRYAHLSSFSVRPGERVTRGQVIGLVGSTGRSTGTHLHYELVVNGQLTNPLSLLNGSRRP